MQIRTQYLDYNISFFCLYGGAENWTKIKSEYPNIIEIKCVPTRAVIDSRGEIYHRVIPTLIFLN